jgi:organic hydroperoxide reductase OsmC/OhrA
MEEWENHMHLSTGKCFEMYFSEFQKVRKFKVKGSDSHGEKVAIDLDTDEEFKFNVTSLLKKDYSTLREIE